MPGLVIAKQRRFSRRDDRFSALARGEAAEPLRIAVEESALPRLGIEAGRDGEIGRAHQVDGERLEIEPDPAVDHQLLTDQLDLGQIRLRRIFAIVIVFRLLVWLGYRTLSFGFFAPVGNFLTLNFRTHSSQRSSPAHRILGRAAR